MAWAPRSSPDLNWVPGKKTSRKSEGSRHDTDHISNSFKSPSCKNMVATAMCQKCIMQGKGGFTFYFYYHEGRQPGLWLLILLFPSYVSVSILACLRQIIFTTSHAAKWVLKSYPAIKKANSRASWFGQFSQHLCLGLEKVSSFLQPFVRCFCIRYTTLSAHATRLVSLTISIERGQLSRNLCR